MFGLGGSKPLARSRALGALEAQVMEVLWAQGEANVREVAQRLARPLAYTTVMTTLDRLYKKGLLERHKRDRAFQYLPRMSREAWERAQASELMRALLSRGGSGRALLFSSFLEAAEPLDERQLAALEREIRRRRQQLSQGDGRR